MTSLEEKFGTYFDTNGSNIFFFDPPILAPGLFLLRPGGKPRALLRISLDKHFLLMRRSRG
jgi:hypothetical protein